MIRKVHPESGSGFFYPSRIPESKKARDPGSRIRSTGPNNPDTNVKNHSNLLSFADPDPVSGAFLTPGSGMGKTIRIRMNNQDG
jgi:hypothetical protein